MHIGKVCRASASYCMLLKDMLAERKASVGKKDINIVMKLFSFTVSYLNFWYLCVALQFVYLFFFCVI